ncbi:hypothetical protein V6N13_149191 [Hibiscus sabdariffa]|uniref:Uncharacterized protein n=1 Tax=Hibiscus sabdariffa TaxID=183260 RepID=A0ABR2EJJ9_9ROSI
MCSHVEETLSGFLFEIVDTPGLQTITLTIEYDGELIKVNVRMPDLVTCEGEADDVDDDKDETGNPSRSSIPLVVNVSKSGCSCLEFTCTVYPDEITIDSLFV